MTPPKLTGKEFEALLMESAKREEAKGSLTMFRYGVQGVIFGGKTMLVPSLPDFAGVLAGGLHFEIEAKAFSDTSFKLHQTFLKDKQVRHMRKTSQFGSRCFLVIHFNERRLVNKDYPAITVAVPVRPDMPFWTAYEAGEVKTLTRDMAQDIGSLIVWRVPKGCRKALPDIGELLRPKTEEQFSLQ